MHARSRAMHETMRVDCHPQIDLEIIADVIENRLHPLVEELERLIAFVERSET